MKIFVNPSGQRENLGDSVLRRGYLNALREIGQLHVLTGDHRDYIEGLGLRKDDVIYSSKRRWLVSALISSARSRTIFAINAGEIVTGTNFLLTSIWQAGIILTQRLGGGHAIAMGIGVRPSPKRFRSILFQQLRNVSYLTWRDPRGREEMSQGEIAPDWAIGLGTSYESLAGPQTRTLLVVSMRGDRRFPTQAWLDAVRALSKKLGSEIVVLEQVKFDHIRCLELSNALDARLLSWERPSHFDHELLVRETYRNAHCVISDRLHALILGLTEGAVPIGLTTESPEKITNTFSPISSVQLGLEVKEGMPPSEIIKFATSTLDSRDAILNDLRLSRVRLEQSASRLADLLK